MFIFQSQMETVQRARELLKMPPVLPQRKEKGELIQDDTKLAGLEDTNVVFTDISQTESNSVNTLKHMHTHHTCTHTHHTHHTCTYTTHAHTPHTTHTHTHMHIHLTCTHTHAHIHHTCTHTHHTCMLTYTHIHHIHTHVLYGNKMDLL